MAGAVPTDLIESDKNGKQFTQMINGVENVAPLISYTTLSAQETLDVYADPNGAYAFLNLPEALKAHKDAMGRGVRIRAVIEITKENLPFVKEAMQYFTGLRHMDGISHTFAVSEKHYMSIKIPYDDPSFTQAIFSNIGWFVREQRYLFETLWKNAIPAKQRIREIEEGAKREFIYTIRDPIEIFELVPKVISSAYEELLVLFPTASAIHLHEKAGTIELLKEVALQRGVKVRILVPRIDDTANEIAQKLRKGGGKGKEDIIMPIDIHHDNKKSLPTRVTTLIADNELSLAMEIRDDIKETSNEAIELATYSNSESIVASYTSIFEKMWIQSEMKKQKRRQDN